MRERERNNETNRVREERISALCSANEEKEHGLKWRVRLMWPSIRLMTNRRLIEPKLRVDQWRVIVNND